MDTLNDKFEEFYKLCAPDDTRDEDKENWKIVFYSGAKAALGVVVELSRSDMSDQAGAGIINGYIEEAGDFVNGYIAEKEAEAVIENPTDSR